MTELEYGINVANKFDLLFGDEDPTEALSKAQVDAKKKKGAAGPATTTAASANVLKEKTARSAAGAKPTDAKAGDAKKVDNKNKPGQPQDKTRTVSTGGAQQGQQQQRPPRSAPQGARPEQGKENSTNPRPPKTEGGMQRSPAGGQGGQRRFGGPRPEGSAPPRRPYNAEGGDFSGAMTGGDQEVPEQRAGFGGRGGYRGGSAYRGGRASPRHQYPREPQQGTEGGAAPSHARGREYERHSGSNKTGVKPVAKREGGGSYNWGSYRDEAEIGTETAHGAAPAEGTPVKVEGVEGEAAHVEGAVVEGAEGEQVPAEPETKEKTLKEWLEEEERNRVRPKYTTRAANEGESEQKVFQKMRRVQRENANADGMVEVVEYVEVDVDEEHGATSSGKNGRGGPFQLVFAPAARTEGSERGRGGSRGGPRGAGRGGPRGGAAPFQGGRGGGQRGGRQAPPTVDEQNFPALG